MYPDSPDLYLDQAFQLLKYHPMESAPNAPGSSSSRDLTM